MDGDKTTVIGVPDSGSGWAIAVIVLIAVIAFGAYYWMKYTPARATTTTVELTLPALGTTQQNP